MKNKYSLKKELLAEKQNGYKDYFDIDKKLKWNPSNRAQKLTKISRDKNIPQYMDNLIKFFRAAFDVDTSTSNDVSLAKQTEWSKPAKNYYNNKIKPIFDPANNDDFEEEDKLPDFKATPLEWQEWEAGFVERHPTRQRFTNPNKASTIYSGPSSQRRVSGILEWGEEMIYFPNKQKLQIKNALYGNLPEYNANIIGETANTKRLKETLVLFCLATNQQSPEVQNLTRTDDFKLIDTRNAGVFSEDLASLFTDLPNLNSYTWNQNEVWFDIGAGNEAYSVKFSHSSLSAARNKTDFLSKKINAKRNAEENTIGVVYGKPSIIAISTNNNGEIAVKCQISIEKWSWKPTETMLELIKTNCGDELTQTGLNNLVDKGITYGKATLEAEHTFPPNHTFSTEMTTAQNPTEVFPVVLNNLKNLKPKISDWILKDQQTGDTEDTLENRIKVIKKINDFFKNIAKSTPTSTKSDKDESEKLKTISNNLGSNSLGEGKHSLKRYLLETTVSLGTWSVEIGGILRQFFNFNQITPEENSVINKNDIIGKAVNLDFTTDAWIGGNVGVSKLHLVLLLRKIYDEVIYGASGGFSTTESFAEALLNGKNLNVEPLTNNFPWADIQTGDVDSHGIAWSVKASQSWQSPIWYPKEAFYKTSLKNIQKLGLLVICPEKSTTKIDNDLKDIIDFKSFQERENDVLVIYKIIRTNDESSESMNNWSFKDLPASAEVAAIKIKLPSLARIKTALGFNEDDNLEDIGSESNLDDQGQMMGLHDKLKRSSIAVYKMGKEGINNLADLQEEYPSESINQLFNIAQKVVLFLKNLGPDTKLSTVEEFANNLDKIYDNEVDGSGNINDKDILLPLPSVKTESIDLSRWNVLSGLK